MRWKEAKQLMEKLTLATKEHDGTWFGVLISEQNGLLACSFSSSKKALEKHLRDDAPSEPIREKTSESDIALTEMMNIYEGRKTTNKVRLDWHAISSFQKDVCQQMNMIPKGRVTSYGTIAKRIKSGPRAVGTAVGSNPWPLFIPCHRVVPANLEIGNYSIGGKISDYGCEVKQELLEREGVPMSGDRISFKALWVPTGA